MNIDERDAVAARFGVAPEQVERDHLISHLLAVLSDRFADQLHFIGGTALARTHLVDGRLSEDIDLVALGNRTELAAEIDAELPRPGHRGRAPSNGERPDRQGAVAVVEGSDGVARRTSPPRAALPRFAASAVDGAHTCGVLCIEDRDLAPRPTATGQHSWPAKPGYP